MALHSSTRSPCGYYPLILVCNSYFVVMQKIFSSSESSEYYELLNRLWSDCGALLCKFGDDISIHFTFSAHIALIASEWLMTSGVLVSSFCPYIMRHQNVVEMFPCP